MRPEVLKLLTDMLAAARGVTSIVRGRTVEQYRADLQPRRAVERGFQIVGRALAQLLKIEPVTAETIPDFRAIISFRNVLIHGYAVVNAHKTWDIAISKLPVLIAEAEQLLGT